MNRYALFVGLCAVSSSTGAGDFYLDLGVSARTASEAVRESALEPPLGIVRLRYVPESNPSITLFIDHLSSIPEARDGSGLNQIGVFGTVKLD